MAISPVIWVITIVTLLRTLLMTIQDLRLDTGLCNVGAVITRKKGLGSFIVKL